MKQYKFYTSKIKLLEVYEAHLFLLWATFVLFYFNQFCYKIQTYLELEPFCSFKCWPNRYAVPHSMKRLQSLVRIIFPWILQQRNMEPFSYQLTTIYVNLKLLAVTVLGKGNFVSMWVSYSLSNMRHYAHVTYHKVIQGSEAFIRTISVTDDKKSIYNKNFQPCKHIRIAGGHFENYQRLDSKQNQLSPLRL